MLPRIFGAPLFYVHQNWHRVLSGIRSTKAKTLQLEWKEEESLSNLLVEHTKTRLIENEKYSSMGAQVIWKRSMDSATLNSTSRSQSFFSCFFFFKQKRNEPNTNLIWSSFMFVIFSLYFLHQSVRQIVQFWCAVNSLSTCIVFASYTLSLRSFDLSLCYYITKRKTNVTDEQVA